MLGLVLLLPELKILPIQVWIWDASFLWDILINFIVYSRLGVSGDHFSDETPDVLREGIFILSFARWSLGVYNILYRQSWRGVHPHCVAQSFLKSLISLKQMLLIFSLFAWCYVEYFVNSLVSIFDLLPLREDYPVVKNAHKALKEIKDLPLGLFVLELIALPLLERPGKQIGAG